MRGAGERYEESGSSQRSHESDFVVDVMKTVVLNAGVAALLIDEDIPQHDSIHAVQ